MKILVGIMYTIENEFNQCIEAIHRQTFKDFDIFVVEKQPNKKAHDELYGTFMNSASAYDFFIKIDADMVLARDTFFEEAIAKMQAEPGIMDLEITVEDFFTNRRINGLHVYRNTMRWKMNSESIFVDNVQERGGHFHDNIGLAPAAYHCPNPSRFQAFHFGLHKGVKVVQEGNGKLKLNKSIIHWDNIVGTVDHYRKSKNLLLAYAIMGAFYGLKNRTSPEFVDFDNPVVQHYFKGLSDRKVISGAKWISFLLKLVSPRILFSIVVFPHFFKNGKYYACKQFYRNVLKYPTLRLQALQSIGFVN